MPRFLTVIKEPEVRLRKPDWIKVKLPTGENYIMIKRLLREANLHTVCEEANCPNIAECWSGGTATFMLMGDTCTRGCRFCNVKVGNPQKVLDGEEPSKIAKAVKMLGLTYIVLTSVARDDLQDGGAEHIAKTVEAISGTNPSILVETLVPDFRGDVDALRRVIESGVAVLAHNIETVKRLTPFIRDRRAGYEQSVQVLRNAKSLKPDLITKSSIMLGLGETESEVIQTMVDLRSVAVDALTIGQYLQPSRGHLPVTEYVRPETFEKLRRIGEEMGFLYVASGPLVRSSYKAGEYYLENIIRSKRRHS
ncbi:MAG: lipoyl synthase [Thaumarchaeota archaeon]|nr:lipoyl synthase [Nitrososphaerota archaeon]